jgi:hypothetical protein
VSLFVLISFPPLAHAQQQSPHIASLRKRLATVEGTLQRIEVSKEIDDLATGDQISRELDAAADDAKAAFDAAMAETRRLSDAKGTTQQLGFLNQLEFDLRSERDRGEKLVQRMSAIDGGIRTGGIKLTPRVLQKLTPLEIQQFRHTLTPGVEKDYKRILPNLFKGEVGHMTDQEWLKHNKCNECVAAVSRQRDSQQGLVSQLYDALVPNANAALGAGCYGICSASLGVACVGCVLAAGDAAMHAYNVLKSCRNRCCGCHWYKPWCCACKGVCYTVFLAALA